MIVPDPRPGSTPEFAEVLRRLAGTGHRRIVVGHTGDDAQPTRDAIVAGGVVLGASGWVRATGTHFRTLTHVDIPAELALDQLVVVLTASSSVEGVIAAWNRIVHPNSALRARVAGDGAIADLALAVPTTYIILLNDREPGVIAVANGPLAGELVALGVARLAEQAQGIEAEGPWEDIRVQRLVEASIGAGVSPALSLDAVVPDNESQEWMARLAGTLGCRLDITDITMESGGEI